ncbi:pentatricopeptide repeat-containing protein At3g13160, mitochondrial-like [Chenopodium quinoa]|uniref:pentatricopeptide repeat-containing protein At3g13160, mitochondrial-like n=1 Tax=Chenopodium quinoa TaxID=63459 RepID=UPI000B7999B2|nr:pentatricopeptide repeat-containing protein At3g13160, mitochondrial-like [Chenopodium quinoa]
MSKSNVCTRLHGLFSSTRNAANSIKSKTPKPTELPHSSKYQAINLGIKDLLDEKDPTKLVQKFNFLSQEKYFRQKHKIYENTIHRLSLAKQNTLIEEALESQKIYIVGEPFAARLIYLYGKAGLFDHARKVFDELPQRGCVQNFKSFNALLGAASNSGKYDKVYELFRVLPSKLTIKPSVHCYNTAAHALCKLGLFDDALSLLDEMEKNGLNPSVVSYNTLLSAFYENKGFEEGEKIWKRMIEKGVVPEVLSYNFKVQRLVNDGRVFEAMGFVTELESKGLKPDVGTYNALILGACKNDDLDEVRLWYYELLNSGCSPNRVTFNTVVPFLCDKGDYGLAYQASKRMFRHQCSVDESLLQKVVDGLTKKSMMEEAKVLVGLGKSNTYFPYDLVLPTGIMRYFL